MWRGCCCMLHIVHVLSHNMTIKHTKHIISFHTSQELTDLTCFDRYWFSSLWLLSTCLDMVPSDDRLSSKFSIVSFVACGGAIYNENKLAWRMKSPDLLLLNQTVRFITLLPVWGCITTHKHVPVTGVKILSTCEWSRNPSGSELDSVAVRWRDRTVTPVQWSSPRDWQQLSLERTAISAAVLMLSFMSVSCGRLWTTGEDHTSRNHCYPAGFGFCFKNISEAEELQEDIHSLDRPRENVVTSCVLKSWRDITVVNNRRTQQYAN